MCQDGLIVGVEVEVGVGEFPFSSEKGRMVEGLCRGMVEAEIWM